MEAARVVIVDHANAYFEQGSIKFQVDQYDLCKVLGAGDAYQTGSVLDRLTDASVIAFAAMNDLPVDPYDRELLRYPLHGVIQLVWCRDVDNNQSDRLKTNQELRVEKYVRQLNELKRLIKQGETPDRGAKAAPRKAVKFNQRYGVATHVDVKTLKGRTKSIYTIIEDLGNPTFADIIRAAEGKVNTKTDLTRVVTYFVNDGVKHGTIELLNHEPKLK